MGEGWDHEPEEPGDRRSGATGRPSRRPSSSSWSRPPQTPPGTGGRGRCGGSTRTATPTGDAICANETLWEQARARLSALAERLSEIGQVLAAELNRTLAPRHAWPRTGPNRHSATARSPPDASAGETVPGRAGPRRHEEADPGQGQGPWDGRARGAVVTMSPHASRVSRGCVQQPAPVVPATVGGHNMTNAAPLAPCGARAPR